MRPHRLTGDSRERLKPSAGHRSLDRAVRAAGLATVSGIRVYHSSRVRVRGFVLTTTARQRINVNT
jgi:hypothetical protein